ncbi:MAG TPA: FliG C-terminal domain-containing protein, partial [bacterium]|nr:FliG C-terminal domain-containing protein [bacterium]
LSIIIIFFANIIIFYIIYHIYYKTKFLTSLCDELDFYIQNFIFFKLGQINIELKNKVFENITTYKHLLKYPADLVQTILNKLAYNELLAIIQHSNNTISSKILLSCSEKMRQTINNSLSQQSLFHSAFIFDAKYKLGKLIKEFCDSDEHYQSSIKNLLASISEL